MAADPAAGGEDQAQDPEDEEDLGRVLQGMGGAETRVTQRVGLPLA